MKISKKIFLESEDWKRLKDKAEVLNFLGKGSLSHYLEKIAREEIIFFDTNTRKFLDMLNLKPTL